MERYKKLSFVCKHCGKEFEVETPKLMRVLPQFCPKCLTDVGELIMKELRKLVKKFQIDYTWWVEPASADNLDCKVSLNIKGFWGKSCNS